MAVDSTYSKNQQETHTSKGMPEVLGHMLEMQMELVASWLIIKVSSISDILSAQETITHMTTLVTQPVLSSKRDKRNLKAT